MTLITQPTASNVNTTVNSSTELAQVIRDNVGIPTPTNTTQGLTYKSFAFNKGFSNTLNQRVYTPDPSIIDSIANNLNAIADGFTISQLNEAGETVKSFNFSLLPAIESSVGGRQVPEIKPGILKRSSVNIKTFTLPGGVPAFQSLGLEPTMLQLVGLLIGSESILEVEASTSSLSTTSKGILPLYTPNSTLNAYQSAMYFEQQIVQINRPVEISISANNSNSASPHFDPTLTIVYKAILQNVRYFIAKQDRIYYSMDALILDYPNIKSLANDKAEIGFTSKPPAESWDFGGTPEENNSRLPNITQPTVPNPPNPPTPPTPPSTNSGTRTDIYNGYPDWMSNKNSTNNYIADLEGVRDIRKEYPQAPQWNNYRLG